MADVSILDVRLHGRSIGALTRLPDDKNLFAFDRTYIEDRERAVLSLSFKDAFGELIADVKPTQTRVPPFFANLLPEGPMRDYLAGRAGVNPAREFFLLWVLGRDLPGAVEIRPMDGESWPDAARAQLAGNSQKRKSAMRFSLAGVQLKFSAVKSARGGLTIPVDGTGGSWIVKLPSTVHDGVPENEFAMMELARRIGMDVPQTALVPLGSIEGMPEGIERAGKNAFAIRRFDRGENGARIHIEDFAQIFALYPDKKYERLNYRNIAEVIWTEIGETGIAEFVRRLVFNTLIGNGDMHAKNWSLIYPDARHAALAPAYDFVSTVAYISGDKLGLNFAGSKDFESVSEDRFRRFAEKARLPEKLVMDTMRDTVQRFASAWGDKSQSAMARKLKSVIDAHLKRIPIYAAPARR
ncbi:MAG: HipA domain-containing protein [Proteobacteria bacterium]|nr:HipA domain-containing protein [Pseudomonadota bacterium]